MGVTTFYNSGADERQLSVESRCILSRYVPRCKQQIIAAKKADDTGLSRRVPPPPGIDLYAVSLARGTPEQNQRRIQGQPSAGINLRRVSDKTTPGGRRGPNFEPSRQHPPFV